MSTLKWHYVLDYQGNAMISVYPLCQLLEDGMSLKQFPTQQLVVWVNELRLPLREIMQRTGMTRQGIWKRLKHAGCFIPRRAPEGAPGIWVVVSCAWCGQPIRKRKRLALRSLHHFCNETCHYASLEAPGYYPWRQGCRLARAIVAQHFTLEPQHVVHHKDGDNRNNDRKNLAVYASNADHVKHHRGKRVVPLWDGSSVHEKEA